MTESWMKGRVKGLLGGTPPGTESPEQADTASVAPPVVRSDPPSDVPSDPDAQRQALQVLLLAQRTADDHVASAHRQAEKVSAEAQAMAQQIVHEAQAHADDLRQDAEEMLTDARASAEQIARDAHAQAAHAQRDADKILASARAQAEEIVRSAQANADQLQHQARQRYDDVVGSLATRREALQEQIEALEHFDRDYRTRLTTFMQAQLRALWVDQPHVDGEIEEPDSVTTGPVPVQRSN